MPLNADPVRARHPEKNLLASFLDEIRSDHTRRAYRSDVVSFFGTAEIVESTVRGVTPGEIDAYFRKGEIALRSQSSLNRRRAALNRFFDAMADRGVIDFNPVRHPRVRTPRSKSKSTSIEPSAGSTEAPPRSTPREMTVAGSLHLARALSREDVERLIREIPIDTEIGRRDLIAVLLCVYTGLRRSDVIRLTTAHLQVISRYCIIHYHNRETPVPEYVRQALIPRGQLARLNDPIPLIYSVARRSYGQSISGNALYRRVRHVGSCIPDRSVTPEVLRQTGARLALASGASVPSVRIHLGHQPNDDVDRDARSRHRRKDSASLHIDVGRRACRRLVEHRSEEHRSESKEA